MQESWKKKGKNWKCLDNRKIVVAYKPGHSIYCRPGPARPGPVLGMAVGRIRAEFRRILRSSERVWWTLGLNVFKRSPRTGPHFVVLGWRKRAQQKLRIKPFSPLSCRLWGFEWTNWERKKKKAIGVMATLAILRAMRQRDLSSPLRSVSFHQLSLSATFFMMIWFWSVSFIFRFRFKNFYSVLDFEITHISQYLLFWNCLNFKISVMDIVSASMLYSMSW